MFCLLFDGSGFTGLKISTRQTYQNIPISMFSYPLFWQIPNTCDPPDSHTISLFCSLYLLPFPIPSCSHAPFRWTSGGRYRGTEYKPSTGLWGERVHWCIPSGLWRRPWHQESCPHDKGMSITSSKRKKKNTHWNTQSETEIYVFGNADQDQMQ